LDHHKYRELWASTARGHLLLPTTSFAETNTYHDIGQGGLPSTSSSTSVVAAAGLRPVPPRGPAIDTFLSFSCGCCRTSASTLKGPPSTFSSASVVATAGLRPAPPKGPAIDVFFSFSGGYCRTSAITPQGAHHRCLPLLRWWWLSDISATPPRYLPSVFF
jgi:hypothetical protein